MTDIVPGSGLPDILDEALTESRTMRTALMDREDVLDKIKALQMLPDGVHLTTELVSNYFEVSPDTIKSLVKNHRKELESSGYRVLRGAELSQFARSQRDLASSIARQVRTYLLDVEVGAVSQAPRTSGKFFPRLPQRAFEALWEGSANAVGAKAPPAEQARATYREWERRMRQWHGFKPSTATSECPQYVLRKKCIRYKPFTPDCLCELGKGLFDHRGLWTAVDGQRVFTAEPYNPEMSTIEEVRESLAEHDLILEVHDRAPWFPGVAVLLVVKHSGTAMLE